MIQADATEVCITPPIGVDLSGYFAPGGRASTDVHDHLMAQALVLDDGETRVALVICDLLAVTPDFVAPVRELIHERTGIPPAHVMVACIHSHTAPATASMQDIGEADMPYVRMVARHVAGAVAASVGKLRPARLSVARGEHPGLAWNRLGRADVNPALAVVRIDDDAGAPLALLAHYACHPVILGPKTIISADYPGTLRRHLRREYPGVILFANGAAGDIDPITNRVAWGQGTFEDVERTGAALAVDVWEAAQRAAPVHGAKIQVRRAAVRLAYDVPAPEAIRARIAQYEAEIEAQGEQPERFTEVIGEAQMPRFWLRHYKSLAERLEAGETLDYKDIEMQAFVIAGELALLALPGELFTAAGRAVQAASPHAHTLPVCYANGAYGYFPPPVEFETAGYAATLAAAVHNSPPFKPDIAARIVEGAARLLQGV